MQLPVYKTSLRRDETASVCYVHSRSLEMCSVSYLNVDSWCTVVSFNDTVTQYLLVNVIEMHKLYREQETNRIIDGGVKDIKNMQFLVTARLLCALNVHKRRRCSASLDVRSVNYARDRPETEHEKQNCDS